MIKLINNEEKTEYDCGDNSQKENLEIQLIGSSVLRITVISGDSRSDYYCNYKELKLIKNLINKAIKIRKEEKNDKI